MIELAVIIIGSKWSSLRQLDGQEGQTDGLAGTAEPVLLCWAPKTRSVEDTGDGDVVIFCRTLSESGPNIH